MKYEKWRKKEGGKKTERGERERERKMKKDTRNETMRDERVVTEEWVKEEEEERKKRAMASNTNMPRNFYSSSCEITNKTFGNTAAAVSFENNCILWTLFSSFPCMEKKYISRRELLGVHPDQTNKQLIPQTNTFYNHKKSQGL